MDLIFIALGALAIVSLWLGLTWWFTPEEHTFKAVIQDALRDVRDICAPVIAFFEDVMNLAFCAVISFSAYVNATPELKEAILRTDYGVLALAVMNALVTMPVLQRLRAGKPDGAMGPGAAAGHAAR